MSSKRMIGRRLIAEAMAGVVQRSSRSALTIVGVALGIGSFIAVLGVTTSANSQISADFNAATATQISAQAIDGSNPVTTPGIEDRVAALNGVEAVGTWWDITVQGVAALPPAVSGSTYPIRVIAASAGYWDLVTPSLESGRTFDSFHNDQPVALVGRQVADTLNIDDVSRRPAIFIDGTPVTVIGIVEDTNGVSAPLAAVAVPAAFAAATFGDPGTQATLVVDAQQGAVTAVARELPLAIDAQHPDRYRITPPPEPTIIRDRVNESTQTLFFALAIIGVLVGAVGITNSTLISVMSRVPEIGLRRSLGAMPRHIAAQFLLEAGIRGVLGGAIGASLGIVTVAIVALSQGWTAVIEPWSIALGPAAGAAIGLLAGLYPAVQAAKIEPVEAFRR